MDAGTSQIDSQEMNRIAAPSRQDQIPRYKIFNSAVARSVVDLEWLCHQLPGWVFRGQAESAWWLQPLLERSRHPSGLRETEASALAQFQVEWKRKAKPAPADDDYLSWLALLRHYNGKTRLLDFSTSLAVALYFACRERSTSRPTIWAVNGLMLARLLSSQIVESKRKYLSFDDPVQGWPVFNHIYPHRLTGFAAALFSPRGYNSRMKAQSGVFLAALNMEYSLEENLYGMFDRNPRSLFDTGPQGYFMNVRKASTLRTLQRAPVLKFELAFEDPDEAEQYLQSKGVSQGSLFPE